MCMYSNDCVSLIALFIAKMNLSAFESICLRLLYLVALQLSLK